MARPGDCSGLTWDYEREKPEEGSRIPDEPDALLVLKEINGYYVHPPEQQARETSKRYTPARCSACAELMRY